MSRRNKDSTQANLLRVQGVPALGDYTLNNSHNNPIGFYNPQKSQYIRLWTNYDFNQNVSKYVWENLPNGNKGWELERMLYFRNTFAGFKIGGKIYILPYYVNSKLLNPKGLPTRIKPLTFNGKPIAGENDYLSDGFELDVDYNGDATDEYSAVICFDQVPLYGYENSASRYYYNSIIIKEIADTFARVNINIVVSNKKIILQCKDPKQAEVIRKELEIAFSSDCPFAVTTSPIESQTIQNTNDFNADELFNVIKQYDSIRCFMSGISSKSFGSDKKERLVSGELAGAEEEKDLILDMGLEMRQEFCDLMNAKFGTNITVRKRSDEYKEEVDGNGMTEDEREEEL